MPLDLSLLSVFDAVARHGNVTRAAEALSVTQPAVSKQLKALQRQVGAKLFDRAGRGVRLSADGEVLADYARRIMALADEAESQMNELRGLRRGQLSIGAGSTVSVYLLPEAIVRFRQRFPGVSLHLETGQSQLLRERLRDGSIEFAISEASLPSPEFQSTVFTSDELVGIVPIEHPLAGTKSITAAKFATEPFVVRSAESGTQSLVERVFRGRGLSVKPLIAVSSTEAVKRAVAAGLGVSIVSKMSLGLELEAKKLAVVRLRDVPLRRPVFLIRQRSRSESRAAIAFLCLLKHVVRGTLPKISRRTVPTSS
jgi:DNA-binding transcriptional LysR family regulator